MKVRISWQMNVFMLREILYGETYDKSPSVYSKIREKGGEEIYQSAWSENPPNLALGRLSWAADFEVPPTHTCYKLGHRGVSLPKFIHNLTLTSCLFSAGTEPANSLLRVTEFY